MLVTIRFQEALWCIPALWNIASGDGVSSLISNFSVSQSQIWGFRGHLKWTLLPTQNFLFGFCLVLVSSSSWKILVYILGNLLSFSLLWPQKHFLQMQSHPSGWKVEGALDFLISFLQRPLRLAELMRASLARVYLWLGSIFLLLNI